MKRIGYLTTEYPAPSHTFIRRELQAVEAQGFLVSRFSIRHADSPLIDAADREEEGRTYYVLDRSPLAMTAGVLSAVIGRPRHFARAFLRGIQAGKRCGRGMLRGMAYVVEACVLLREIGRQGVEHLHVHFGTNACTVAQLVRLLGGPPFSVTVHGPDEFDNPRGLDLAGKLREATAAFGISEYTRSQLCRWCEHEHWMKLSVVRCGVPIDAWSCVSIPERSNTFVCIGRLAPQKGHMVMLEAVRILRDLGLGCRVRIIGGGELQETLAATIADLGLTSSVDMLGWCTEQQVQAEIQAARAGLFPSFAEGLPVAIMEVLAMGRPVVSTYIAGIPELVSPNVTGWLVPAGNAMHLAQAMADVLSKPSQHLEWMGRQGRMRVERQHNTQLEAARLMSTLVQRSRNDDRAIPSCAFEREPEEATASAGGEFGRGPLDRVAPSSIRDDRGAGDLRHRAQGVRSGS